MSVWIIGAVVLGLCVLRTYIQDAKRIAQREREKGSLRGKVVIITGGNGGIGKATAIELAYRGATIYLACRSKERAQTAIDEIVKTTGNHDIKFMKLDLCDFKSIESFVESFKALNIPCDILINNAGVLYLHGSQVDQPTITKDGIILEFMSNYLGHFVLTILMSDLLHNSNARIINVTSATHKLVNLDLEDIEGVKRSHAGRYSHSKLCQIYFTMELQRRLEQLNSKATCNCVHPGYIATEIARWLPGYLMWLYHFIWNRIFGWSAFDGAAGVVLAATSEEIEGVGGKYFQKTQLEKLHPRCYDRALITKVWNISMQMAQKYVQLPHREILDEQTQ